MPFVLSQQTASALQELIAENPGSGAGGNGSGASRQVCYVRCESWASGTGTCVVTEYNALTSNWTNYGSSGNTILLSAQGSDLTATKRYVAIRYGTSLGKAVFVAFHEAPVSPEVGCGLFYDADDEDKLKVQLSDIKGQGLKVFDAVGDGCKTLGIDPGCHITLEGGSKVGVTVDGMAGCGLKATPIVGSACKILEVDADAIAGEGLSGSGCTLDINYGCGLDLESDGAGGERIRVYSPDLAGQGLVAASGNCALNVNPGCGIEIVDDLVKVKPADVAGNGLVASTTDCKIHVNPGCGITLNGGAEVAVHADTLAGSGLVKQGTCSLRIDPSGVSGPAFSAVTNVSLSISGCTVSLASTVTPFAFLVNPGGAFVGFEAGTPSTSTQSIDLCGCECISGSGAVAMMSVNRHAIKSESLGASLKFF